MNTPALLVCLAALAQPPAAPAAPTPAQPSNSTNAASARGLSGAIEVPAGSPRLAPLPHQVPDAPMAVRVNDLPGGGQRIEYIGVVAGTYDLREYLVREDGKNVLDLPPLVVKVESRLAADHGEDVLGLAQTNFALHAYYSRILMGLGAAWLLVPTIAIVRRMLRAKPQVQQQTATPALTLAERLVALMDECGDRPMSLPQRARLELLLLHYWSDRVGTAPTTPRELVEAMARVRTDARTRPIVMAIETWLHGKDADSPKARDEAAAKLRQFRSEELAATQRSAPEGTTP